MKKAIAKEVELLRTVGAKFKRPPTWEAVIASLDDETRELLVKMGGPTFGEQVAYLRSLLRRVASRGQA